MEHIRAVGRKRLRNQNDLDDFVQETVARVYANRSQLRDPSKIKRWIAGVARNTANEWNRALSRRREQPLLNENDLPDPRNPHDALEQAERNAQIREALNRLNAADRALLRERHLEGASYEELQERHGLSYSGVGMRLHRAKRRLKKILRGMKIALVLPLVNLKRYAFGGILAMSKTTKIVLATAAVLILALLGGYLWVEYGGGASGGSAPGLTVEEQTPPVNADGSTDANGAAQTEASDGAGAAQPIQARQNGGGGEENLSADTSTNSAEDDAFSIALKEAVQELSDYWRAFSAQAPEVSGSMNEIIGIVETLLEMDARMRAQGLSVDARRLRLFKKHVVNEMSTANIFMAVGARLALKDDPTPFETMDAPPTSLMELLKGGMSVEEMAAMVEADPEMQAEMEAANQKSLDDALLLESQMNDLLESMEDDDEDEDGD